MFHRLTIVASGFVLAVIGTAFPLMIVCTVGMQAAGLWALRGNLRWRERLKSYGFREIGSSAARHTARRRDDL